MASIYIRPADTKDVDLARDSFPDLLPDRWREGGNRRSFVAVLPRDGFVGSSHGEEIVGHCRGIDNAAHPRSRILVFDVSPALHGTDAERDLLRALTGTSALPLHSKLEQGDDALRALLVSAGSTLVQLMPPGRYVVDDNLKAWARSTLATQDTDCQLVPAAEVSPEDVLALEVDHYIAQHETWSPAAQRADLLDYLSEDHDPSSPGAWNRDHSRAVTTRDGALLAGALVWGAVEQAEAPSRGDEAPEVGHLSRPYASPASWANKLCAIAGVIQSVPMGTVLCIDSHLSMQDEFTAIGSIPGANRDNGQWRAIVATPAPGGVTPTPLDPALIPDAASWAREFTRG